MVASNSELLTDFDELDCCTNQYLWKKLQDKRYKLGEGDMAGSYVMRLPRIEAPLTSCSIVEIHGSDTKEPHLSRSPEISSEDKKYNGLQIATPLRPTEFRSITALPMLLLFLTLMILLAALYARSKAHGR